MGKRKHLTMGIEEFFALATLAIGKPQNSARDFRSFRLQHGLGVTFWCRETQEGQRWAEFVSKCGEAKERAPRLYRWYMHWYYGNETERAHLIHRLKEGLPKSGKQAMYGG